MAKQSKVSSVVQEDIEPIESRVEKFTNLLRSIENLSEKKIELWCEIYKNAVTDRNNALLLYNSLVGTVVSDNIQHAIHAPSMAKYIEKMSRSNDQLLSLAELIADAEKQSQEINSENIYSALERDDEE